MGAGPGEPEVDRAGHPVDTTGAAFVRQRLPVRVPPMTAPAKPRRRKDFGVGAWLKKIREDVGLSQAEVARRMGVDPAAVWQIEQGRLDFRMSTLLRFVDALGARIHIGLAEQAHTDSSTKGG